METFHRLEEDEFFDIEKFSGRPDFKNKITSCLIFFNTVRKNRHKHLLEVDKTLSLNDVLRDIKKIKATQIALKRSSIVLRTELEGNASQAFKAVGLKIPPRLLSDPVDDHKRLVVRL